jgi:glycine/D-amino acid oxidase-like deaminating enzyme
MRALVLGAGLQGTCVAHALRRAGHAVELVDRAAAPLLGASFRNEGKIHLGLVYARDAADRTAAVMLDGACSFARLIDEFVGVPLDWVDLRSLPFTYVALPNSMVTVDALRTHYAAVEAAYHDRDDPEYLGLRPARLVCEIGPRDLRSCVTGAEAAFKTVEAAVDPTGLRKHLVDSLRSTEIVCRFGHDVRSAERTKSGFTVECSTAAGCVRLHADVVVNCLWDGRLAIDDTIGIAVERAWLYRLKYRVVGRLNRHTAAAAGALPSLTFVVGPYGDVVARSGGEVCVSWYPACMVARSCDLRPPDDWRPAMDGTLSRAHASPIAARAISEFAMLVPALRDLTIDHADAGVIFSWGDSDIDDPDSELHQRHDIGVHAYDGWFSIDTGKLTTAPLFAQRLVAAL